MEIREGITFDDVLLQPNASDILPNQVDLSTHLTQKIKLNNPFISAAMDTVTESALAIAMAQLGGLGVIHRNLSIELQCEEVRNVKRFVAGMVVNPVMIDSETNLAELRALAKKHNISGIPVIDHKKEDRLVGIITNRDIRFTENPNQKVSELMTKNPVCVMEDVNLEEARALLHKHRIERVVVIDSEHKCKGLITVKDMEKSLSYPDACKDQHGRLCVGAAISVGDSGFERAESLIDSGVDVIVVDTAHGHSKTVIEQVARLKKAYQSIEVIAGNIVTTSAAKALIDSGADAIKVGVGPGSICTTRIIAGVGVPQLTAISDVLKACKDQNIPVIADGGVKYSGDAAKALAAGANCIMIGSLLAGTDESPGEVFLYQGRSYKSYRGMGSVSAMARGSADRYFQKDVSDTMKLVPEGIEARVPYKGHVEPIIHQLTGGVRAAMGYTGAGDLDSFHKKAKFIRITNASLRESHVHDVSIARESPNYSLPG